MTFERFFRSISYAAVFCGFISLWVTGTFGLFESVLFVFVMIAGWLLEGSRWQIPEKLGTTLIVLALPASYGAYRLGLLSFTGPETAIAGVLARMILSLSAIKLLQKKSDRDWIFLYLMSFFEVLLAAGLSISLTYLGSFVLYFLVMVCTVIAFEMRKTGNDVSRKIGGGGPAGGAMGRISGVRKLPAATAVLVFFIILLAAPLFFLLPRVGGAGLGSFPNSLSTQTGFSDTVKLGGIGRLQQNDAVVMRVKIEGEVAPDGDLYFRGTALDTFDNRSWSRAGSVQKEPFVAGDKDLIQLDFATGKQSLLVQTIYLEPLDTPILFSVPKTVAVQGNFPVLYKDRYGAITFQPANDRTSYKVLSDVALPSAERLRADNQAYGIESADYLQLPQQFDQRISDLASTVSGSARSRYDKALAVESYLKRSYGYTLEMKSGGPEPVADFLFNVKEGHCEYFASAMAVMLRTQGVATRIVNGFLEGEYNETAGMYVVRQRHAHAWVEVFFPKENVWVPFDPTPASSETGGTNIGLLSKAGKYLEALDALWIQYFVAFDNQGQRSLARTLRTGLIDYQARTSTFLARLQRDTADWWKTLRGDNGVKASISALGMVAAFGVLFLGLWIAAFAAYRRLRRSQIWKRIGRRHRQRSLVSIVEFYERMVAILQEKGLIRAAGVTPMEFARSLGNPETVYITEKYNEVRFGARSLSRDEANTIQSWLERIKAADITLCKED